MKGCSVPGCYHVHAAHGLCNKHVQRKRARATQVVHAPTCACLPCLRRAAAYRRLAVLEERAGRESLIGRELS